MTGMALLRTGATRPRSLASYVLADLVKWAKLDKEIGAKPLDREDAEWVEKKGGLSRLYGTCAR